MQARKTHLTRVVVIPARIKDSRLKGAVSVISGAPSRNNMIELIDGRSGFGEVNKALEVNPSSVSGNSFDPWPSRVIATIEYICVFVGIPHRHWEYSVSNSFASRAVLRSKFTVKQQPD